MIDYVFLTPFGRSTELEFYRIVYEIIEVEIDVFFFSVKKKKIEPWKSFDSPIKNPFTTRKKK